MSVIEIIDSVKDKTPPILEKQTKEELFRMASSSRTGHFRNLMSLVKHDNAYFESPCFNLRNFDGIRYHLARILPNKAIINSKAIVFYEKREF